MDTCYFVLGVNSVDLKSAAQGGEYCCVLQEGRVETVVT